jgi:hypothetical protein
MFETQSTNFMSKREKGRDLVSSFGVNGDLSRKSDEAE